MKKQISVLFLLRVIKLAVSIFNLSLAARYFGVTIDRDVWVLALNCLVVIDLAVWGPVNETFRAKFIMLRESAGEQAVLGRVKSLLVIIVLVSLALTGGLLAFPQAVTGIVAPGYTGGSEALLMQMIRLLGPALLLNELTLIGISILNAYESFYIPEVSGFIAAVFNLLCLVILAPFMGIFSLVVGYYFGLILLAILLVIQLRKRKIALFSGYKGISPAGGYPFIRYALPFFFPYFFIQLNLLIEKSLASLLGDGTVSTLDYARKLVDIPIHVLTSVLLTILVPVLSVRFARGDHQGFQQEFAKILRFGMLVVTALIALFCSSAVEMISIVMAHDGQMGAPVVTKISSLSQHYAWSSLVNFFYILFGLALLSSGKGKYYAFFGVIAQLVMIGLNFLLYRTLGAYVFPFSFIIAHSAAAVLLFVFFPGSRKRLLPDVARYGAVLLVVTGCAWAFSSVVRELAAGLRFTGYIVTGINGLFILTVMFIFIYLFRLEERFVINQFFRKIRSVSR